MFAPFLPQDTRVGMMMIQTLLAGEALALGASSASVKFVDVPPPPHLQTI